MSTIGFLVKTYPKISETFILEEILGLEALGVTLQLFSLQAPTDAFAHADTARVRAGLTYVLPRRRDLASALLRSPLRTAHALWLVLTQPGLRWRDLRSGASLAHHLRHHGITHLHSHFISEPAAVAQAAAALAGATFSVSAHAKDIYLSPPQVLRAKLGAARFTVTCTEHNRAYLARLAPPGAHVSRMYHGIDLERFQRAQPPSAASAPLILAVGRLKQKKGFHVLIDACRVLHDRGLRFDCEIVGYGEERESLHARIAAHGLETSITLSGKLDRAGVIARYRAASVFALPCVVADDGDRDGIPNVMLEALAMRLPVVSTPVSGIPEILTHGRNGLLVAPNDAIALADALAQLLADSALREDLGNQGRLTVAAQCCNARNLDHLRQLLSLCTAAGAKPLPRLESIHAGPREQTDRQIPGSIAYIIKGFPRLSETFIAQEIHLLESMGLSLRLFSVKPGEHERVHDVVRRIRAPIDYLPEATSLSATTLMRWLRTNLPQFRDAHRTLFRHGRLRYLRTLCAALAMCWRYRIGPLAPPRKVFIKEFLQAGEIAHRILREGHVAHLHGHFCHGATTITWFVSRLTGLPFSFTAHAKDIYQADLNPGDLLPRKIAAARFVTTCTGANQTHLSHRFPRHKPVHTVYHGLDTAYFSPAARTEEDASNGNPPLILAVGRLVEKKGFIHLIEACGQLRARGFAFRCAIVGERGDQSAAIAQRVAELNLGDVVHLPGPKTQTELRQYYAQATAFALPCLITDDGDRDGIPNVMAEAMAMGLPVVSTPISGIPELVADGVEGLLVPPRDSTALANALARLLSDSALAARVAGAARARICECFDARKTTLKLRDLFLAELENTRAVA